MKTRNLSLLFILIALPVYNRDKTGYMASINRSVGEKTPISSLGRQVVEYVTSRSKCMPAIMDPDPYNRYTTRA